jgi:multiple sugar transport system permease protein
VLFSLGPITTALGLAFYQWDNLTPPRFVGLANWDQLFHDELFWKALRNTLFYVVGSVPTGVILALGLALIVNARLPGIGLFRTVYFTPVVTSTVAVALVWTWVYDSNYGLLNYVIEQIGKLVGLKIKPIAWLNDPRTAMPAIIAMSVWKGLGYNMIIFLAALQNVPRELYEAAAIDGANRFRQFWHVTLPSISPVMFFVVVTSLIGAFQVFDQVYIMARDGRPANSTLTLVYYLYNHAFRYLNMGYACTIGMALFVLIGAVTGIQLVLQKKWVHA